MNDEGRSADRHGSACGLCMDGGDLLCCDGCPTAVHAYCAGLEEVPEVSTLDISSLNSPVQSKACGTEDMFLESNHRRMSAQGDWFCDACVARGAQLKAKPLPSPQKPSKPAKWRQPKQKAPKEKKHGGLGAAKKAAHAGAPRVHMAAPALRVVSGARRERNSNKHKRLFLPDEPGGLTVTARAL